MSNPGTEGTTPSVGDRSPRPRAGFVAVVRAVVLLLAVSSPRFATAAAVSIQSHELAADARVVIGADAVVRVHAPAGTVDQILLRMSSSLHTSRPLRHSEDWVFTTLRREGDEGGRRGFSAHSDDDGDGRVDEERLDGRDNDGDGRIDEDFAAIGDDMTAVGTMRGGRALFLETYHWDYPHLSETLFTSWRREGRDGEPQRDKVTLVLPFGLWQEMTVGWEVPRSAGAADEMMMVASLPRDGGRWWIGVTVLERGGDVAPPRVDGRRLEFPYDGTLVCAVSVSTTLTQLRQRQAAAHAVYAGAPAGPGQPAVPWIVPPLSLIGVDERPLAATWTNGRRGWWLSLEIPAGHTPFIDPETLCAGAARPGVPTRVSWHGPEADADWEAPWPRPDHAELWHADATPHPYSAHREVLRTRAGGVLTFHYSGATPLDAQASLSCRAMSGQTVLVEATCAVDASVVSDPPGRGDGAREGENATEDDARADRPRPPSLSPDLLDNFPNPFRDHTRLRYKVPATVGEGFVWAEGQEPTLKADDPIPYQSLTPSVSLKVYTVAGHEVVTIFDGICAVGTYEAAWDGLDRDGRPLAVGTYFCKLQIDNWSVTKRVALLR